MPYHSGAFRATFLAATMALFSLEAEAHDQKRIDVMTATADGCSTDAIPDDGQDDTEAFVCALSLLRDRRGVLHVPAGRYHVKETLLIGPGVTVVGDGISSVVEQIPGDWASRPLFLLMMEATLRDIQVDQPQPDPVAGWKPDSGYDFIIRAVGDDGLIENVLIWKAYRGIDVTGFGQSSIGRVLMRNIRGQPFQTGIQIDNGLDVVRVENVHFWPFWSRLHPQADAVAEWQQNNGTAIRSRRNDNPFFTNIFVLGYFAGMAFESSPVPCSNPVVCGVTSKAKVVHLDADECEKGIYVTAKGTKGLLVTDFSYQGYERGGAWHGVGIHVWANDVWMMLQQGDITEAGTNAIRVEGNGVLMRVDSTAVRNWNRTCQGFPAFEFVSGSNSRFEVRTSYHANGCSGPICKNTVICDAVWAPL